MFNSQNLLNFYDSTIFIIFTNSKFDITIEKRLIYTKQQLKFYKKRDENLIIFRLTRTKNALIETKKNKKN